MSAEKIATLPTATQEKKQSQLPFFVRPGAVFLKKRFGRITEHIYPESNTTVTFLPSGRRILDRIKHMNDAARHTFALQSYSFDIDTVGQELVDEIRDAHERRPGVRRTIIVDNSIGWWNNNGAVNRRNGRAQMQKDQTFAVLNQLEDEGKPTIQVRITNWFHFLRRGSSNPFHRDHKKIAVADGNIAVVGSANIGEHHVQWLDAGLFLQGPGAEVVNADIRDTLFYTKRWEHVYKATSVLDYFRRYRKDIRREPDRFFADIVGSVVRNPQRRGKLVAVHSPNGEKLTIATDSYWPWYREATRTAYSMIAHGQPGAVVSIFSPYPGMYTLTAKMIAAVRTKGVTVNLYIPENNTYVLYNPKKAKKGKRILQAHLDFWKYRLKKAGVHVFEFQGDGVNKGMNHMKAISIENPDGTAELFIGSMNFNKGILAGSNREIGITTNNKRVMQDFRALRESIVKQSLQTF